MYCQMCGAKNADDVQFCPSCGARSVASPQAPPPVPGGPPPAPAQPGAYGAPQPGYAQPGTPPPSVYGAPQEGYAPPAGSMQPAYPPPYQGQGYYRQPPGGNYVHHIGGQAFQTAGFWIRFGGALIDGFCQLVLAFIVGFIFTIALGDAGFFIGFYGVWLGYTLVFTAEGGGPGMKAVGIRIIDAQSGGKPGYGKAFIRMLVSLASGLFYLGYLWMIWDGKKQTWHDKAADTLVVTN